MTAGRLQGLRGGGSGRNTWKADIPDRSGLAPPLWGGALGARTRFSVRLLCGLHCGIHASTLAHSCRPETLFSEVLADPKVADGRIKLAEREGFEPPIGLHLCRISSAVHSTTLPPLLKAPSKEHGPCGSGVNRRGWRARQGLRGRKSGRFSGWTHDVTVMIGGDRGFRRRFAREWA